MTTLNQYTAISFSAYAEYAEKNNNNKILKELGLNKEQVKDLKFKTILKNNKPYVKIELVDESDYIDINSEYKTVGLFDKVIYIEVPLLKKKFKIYSTNNGDDFLINDFLINYMYGLRTTYKEFLGNDINEETQYIHGGIAGLFVKLTNNDILTNYIFNK